MQEKLKIFSDDKINKLTDDVNEFLVVEDHVLLDIKYTSELSGSKLTHTAFLWYQDWTGEKITPKKKGNYKWKRADK